MNLLGRLSSATLEPGGLLSFLSFPHYLTQLTPWVLQTSLFSCLCRGGGEKAQEGPNIGCLRQGTKEALILFPVSVQAAVLGLFKLYAVLFIIGLLFNSDSGRLYPKANQTEQLFIS